MTLEEAYKKRTREFWALQHENGRLKKQLEIAEEAVAAYDELRSLRHENSKLRKQIEKITNQAFTPKEKTELLKEIVSLKRELRWAEKDRDAYHGWWEREHSNHLEITFRINDLEAENRTLRNRIEELEAGYDAEADVRIKALSDEVARLTAILNNNGANSGTPTSKTSIDQKKHIPNSREKTGKSRGGQPGHKKSSLEQFKEDEVSEHVEHVIDVCPDCGTALERSSERIKDEIDYEVKVIKRRHHFVESVCPCCGKTVHEPVPKHLKEPVQYGENVQATALSLLNLGFVSVGRTQRFMDGLLSGNSPCQGYIINLQKRYSKQLKDFGASVRRYCLNADILYWDDTVVFMNTVRGCMRFYGDEHVALYRAHLKKDKDGLDEDNILNLLSPETIVMHDHNTINYNDGYNFTNAECNQHLLRDLQKLYEISHHEWTLELKELISSTIHRRKLIILENGFSFSDDEIGAFFSRFGNILEKAGLEFAADQNEYYTGDERRLINRLRKYGSNYFMWVKDFKVPTSNNLSERSLRMIKCHEKVSGQFYSAETAGYFADIRTYLETCLRNGVNEFEALSRLTGGNPYTLDELLPDGA